ncbi:MAG: metallophosphoesterase, partial [Proteobacteria bacterium]|nr:metallophosphoesterase [Pseudomonadota bacterium]
KELVEKMESSYLSDSFFILPVPGNHDYFKMGLRITDQEATQRSKKIALQRLGRNFLDFFKEKKKKEFQPPKTNLFLTNLCNLCYPNDSQKDVALDIFKKHNIAIYPLDSNSLQDNISLMAEGNVEDPCRQFAEYEEMFKAEEVDFEMTRVNIAMLHHHPLPLPISPTQQDKEPFLILKNSHEFLYAAEEHNINMILHGHEHVGGLSLYKTSQAKEQMLVFACGSSLKPSVASREAKLITVKQSGAVSYKNLVSSDQYRKFIIPKDSEEVISYGTQRKLKSSSITPLDGDPGFVKNVTAKKKLVTLKDDGTAYIRIVHEGIKWKDGVTKDLMVIKERLQSDVGRIHYGWETYCEERQNSKVYHLWNSPSIQSVGEARPVEEENFIVDIRPKISNYLAPNHRAHCELEYPFFNGFVLNQTDHQEVHGDISGTIIEFCSINVFYPTELLELTIQFPSADFFPEEHHINPFALKSGKNGLSYMKIIENDFDYHHEETDFLNKKLAKRYNSEFCQVSLVVRYPQPELLYTLIWELPKSKREARLEDKDKEIAEKLRHTFLDKESERLEEFYQDLSSAWDIDSLRVVLLGIDTENRVLRVMKGPKYLLGCEFSIGRGLAGKALRSRKVQFYKKATPQQSSDGELIPHIEVVRPGFDPYAALALPLMYPRIDKVKWDNITETSGMGRCPIFSVISLISDSHDSFFDEFGKKDDEIDNYKIQNSLIDTYSAIFKALETKFDNIL